MRFILEFFIVLMVQCVLTLPVFAQTEVKEAVVKIYTTYNRHNYHEPWQMMGQATFQGSGSVIAGNRIVTNAHVVSDQMFIQVRRAGKAKKYTAHIETASHENDLAILTVEDESFFSGITPLGIGKLPEVRDKVAVYGFPTGGDKLSITEGVVSRVEHSNYAHSGAYLLSCQIDASINTGSSGGPVIRDGKIVGVAFQGLSSGLGNIGYMVPAPVLQHLLEDLKDGKHDGTPDLGISMQKLENPEMRRYFQMSDEQTGILVNKVYPDSPAEGILKTNDVILSIEGDNIENDGTIEFRKSERTYFAYTLQKKQMHDTVLLRILRNGEVLNVTIRLTKAIDFERLVPQRKYDVPPTYYVIGGMVFEPLTLNYLHEYGVGNKWYYNAPTELLNYYLNEERTDERTQVIVMVKVLADELNVGFHDSRDVVIASVNGRKISTMRDLVKAFEDNKDEYHVIEDVRGYKIALNRKSVEESSGRILEKYNIESDRSEDLKNLQ